jgi:hypothetical protein
MKLFLQRLSKIVFLYLIFPVISVAQNIKRENNHHIHHKLNDEIVMIITSTGVGNHKFIRDRIIPSARTWMKHLANVFVILEDTFEVRFAMRHCEHTNTHNVTSFNCNNEPIYVLSRRCSSDYYKASSACCKFDEGINFVKSQKHIYDRMKFLLQGDDDTFWRVDQLERWLAVVEKSVDKSIPLVGNTDNSLSPEDVKKDGGGVWHIKGCNEIHGNGWYQPLMLSRAAVDLIVVGTAKYGATETCTAFEVSQDVGLAIFFWLYQLQHIKMPGVVINGNHLGSSVFKPDQMAVHDIKHIDQDDCEGKKEWPQELRYDQAVSIGCGKIGTSGPFHNSTMKADMYDAFAWFAMNGKNVSVDIENENDFIAVKKDNVTHIMPTIRTLNGYDTTKHSEKYNITKEWKAFTFADCMIPGSVG